MSATHASHKVLCREETICLHGWPTRQKQFNARVIADDNPTVAELNDLFGDHTFFLDARGLNVLELIELPQMEPESGEVINLADWSDATLTKLRTHRPEPTGIVIRLKETQH